jgi:hypothetical protein
MEKVMIIMRMKIGMLLCFTAVSISAQTEEQAKTVLGNRKVHIGYFVSPMCQFGKIAGSTAVTPGVGVGLQFNNKISIEALYKRIANENTLPGETDTRFYLDAQWIGVRCAYSIAPLKPVHLNIPIEIGAGEVELDLKDSFENDLVEASEKNAWYAYVEPSLACEINIWTYVKFNLAAGYRFASDVSFRKISERDLMGFTYSAGLRIGIF